MSTTERLDPVRWRRPARSTLIRAGLVAALLLLAAAVLTNQDPGVRRQSPLAAPGTAPASPPPSSRAEGLPGLGSRADPERPPARLPVPRDRFGVTVRLADADLLHPGDRIDLFTLQPRAGAEVVPLVADVLVLAVPSSDAAPTSAAAAVQLAATLDQARRLMGIASDVRIGVTVRPR